LSAEEMPVLLGTGGGPAWTPRVINAFSGNAVGEVSGADLLQADAPRTAPPITADIDAASIERRETPPDSCAQ
jgi:hypothetical protein